jgi:PAS domain S-box-containing protein
MQQMTRETQEHGLDVKTKLRLLEKAFAHIGDIILITDAAPVDAAGPRILFANDAVTKHLGYAAAELIGQSPRVFQGEGTDRETLARIHEALQAGRSVREEMINYTKDGKEVWIDLDILPVTDDFGTVTNWVSIARDITKRKQGNDTCMRLQEKLFQSQKMESIVVLAGGIAHDFNNILTGILGSAELARMSLDPSHAAYTDLETIIKAAQRAAALTKDLLEYAGSGKTAHELVDLNDMVTSILVILRSQMPKSIIVRKALMPGVPLVEADPVQLQQAMMNLCLNASEAMSEHGGILSITTDKAVLSKEDVSHCLYGPPAPGVFAVFEVSDTGSGMEAPTVARIFEPFFSTKSQGRGLGLAAVVNIVKTHRGGIEVISTPGEGSTFRVYLPASTKQLPKEIVERRSQSRGTQTILFVDDEEMLRSLSKRALEQFGYRVLLAADGVEAVRLYREHEREIDLVVLDLSMPRKGGEDAFQEMHAINASVKVLLCCGYNEALANKKIATENLVGFLPKPFGLETLAQTVQNALKSR